MVKGQPHIAETESVPPLALYPRVGLIPTTDHSVLVTCWIATLTRVEQALDATWEPPPVLVSGLLSLFRALVT